MDANSNKSDEDVFSSSLPLEKVNLIYNPTLILDENDGLIYEGKMLLDAEDYQQAISKFTEQIKISFNSNKKYTFYLYRDSFYLRGFAFYKLKKYTNAINDFDTLLSIDPRYYDALYWRGHSNYILRNYTEAFKDSSKLVAIRGHEKNSSLSTNSLSIMNDSKFMMSLVNQ